MRRATLVVAVVTAALLTPVLASPAQAATDSSLPGAVVADNGPGDGDGTDAAAIDAAQQAAQADGAKAAWTLAQGAGAAGDMMGWEPSLYTGKYFKPGKEEVRRCILDRESNFNYRANNGSYFGAYQMSADLAVGATWNMVAEVRKDFGAEGVRMLEVLRGLTPDKWNRYWQDRAFWTIWSYPTGQGPDHWGGARCKS